MAAVSFYNTMQQKKYYFLYVYVDFVYSFAELVKLLSFTSISSLFSFFSIPFFPFFPFFLISKYYFFSNNFFFLVYFWRQLLATFECLLEDFKA